MKLSIVTSLYQSARYIEDFVARADKAAQAFCDDYEIILVNDGSTDDSLNKACALIEKFTSLKIINLSRNFGHHQAMMAGLRHSVGEFIFILDCDLEEQPEWLDPLYTRLDQANADIVYAIQKKRNGAFLTNALSSLFYDIFNALSKLNTPKNAMVARLMRRKFLNKLISLPEQIDFLPGQFAYTGFAQETIELEKHCKGTSSYSLKSRLKLAGNAIIRYSDFPLKAIAFAGGLAFFMTTALLIWSLLQHLIFGITQSPTYLIMLSIFFVGSILLSTLGIMSLYLMRIFDEVKNRPSVIIDTIYTADSKQ